MTSSQNTPKRKYVLTRLTAGDYLLPGNSGKMIFRISKYDDGPPEMHTCWGVWEWSGPNDDLDVTWDPRWEILRGALERREQAIAWALRFDAEVEAASA